MTTKKPLNERIEEYLDGKLAPETGYAVVYSEHSRETFQECREAQQAGEAAKAIATRTNRRCTIIAYRVVCEVSP